jgi:HK97 family phage portal protein
MPNPISSYIRQHVVAPARETRAAPTSGMAVPQTWFTESLSTGTAPSGKRVTVANAMGLAPVWAAVSLIAEQVGQLPLKVYREVDGERTEARSHRAWSMLHDKPNDHTPADRFWSTVTTQLLLYGNAFLRKHRDQFGLVDELSLLNPAHMLVYWDGDQRIKSFNYQPLNGEQQQYSADEVLHIFGLSLDGVIGESVISRCKAALGAAMARDEFEGGFYNRGAQLAGVLEAAGKLSPEAAKNLGDSFAALYGGSAKAHGTPVLEEGVTFKPVGSPLKDLEFVAAQQMSRTDIAVMFKLPPNYLGGASGDSLTYATVESNQIQFALHAISPWTNVIASAITSDPGIFPQNVFNAEFVIDGMLRADAGARSSYYKTMMDIGAMTPNEVRRLENLPPLPGGDAPQVPTTERISVAEPQAPGTEPPTPPPEVPNSAPAPVQRQLAAVPKPQGG